jgi:phosphatidylethanolamine/phosphatidyl-N-methylethanolamine N-methyltransferase
VSGAGGSSGRSTGNDAGSGAPAEAVAVEADPFTASRHDAADATAFYDRWARWYDLLASTLPVVGRLRRRAVDALRLDRGDLVVDVGCGTGANLPLLAREVGPTGTVIGVDRSRGVLERARRNARGYPQVEVLRADATALPIGANDGDDAATPEESVALDDETDGVLATFVVGMLAEPADAVADWIEHLESDGHVALLHLRRSEHALAPIANRALAAATVCSTPPARKLRYERDITRVLDARVRAATAVVEERTDPTLAESHLFDLVDLTAGRRS